MTVTKYRILVTLYEVELDEDNDIEKDHEEECEWYGEYTDEQEARIEFNKLVQPYSGRQLTHNKGEQQ